MLKANKSAVTLQIYAQPNGKISEVLGRHGSSLKIRIKAQPIDGKANAEVENFIAKIFKVSVKQVQIVKGHLSRNKVVEIKGLSLDEAIATVEKAIELIS